MVSFQIAVCDKSLPRRAPERRRGVGALIVKDRRILATGYNGVPTGMRHCAETGCLRQQLKCPLRRPVIADMQR